MGMIQCLVVTLPPTECLLSARCWLVRCITDGADLSAPHWFYPTATTMDNHRVQEIFPGAVQKNLPTLEELEETAFWISLSTDSHSHKDPNSSEKVCFCNTRFSYNSHTQ